MPFCYLCKDSYLWDGIHNKMIKIYFAPLQGYTESAYRRAHAAFCAGVECAFNAPTAVNQQKFFFTLLTDNETVIAKPQSTLIGYKFVDLGIAKLHFELAVEEAERQCGHKLPFKWIED